MTAREPVAGFAMAAALERGAWWCNPLSTNALTSLDTALTEVRAIAVEGAVLGLLNVDDEFFVLLRPAPGGAELLLSDASAALDYDIAADVLDMLRVPTPDEDDDAFWPEGDLAIVADLGLPAEELAMIAGDMGLYPDEQLRMIAQRCGFGDQYDEAVKRTAKRP